MSWIFEGNNQDLEIILSENWSISGKATCTSLANGDEGMGFDSYGQDGYGDFENLVVADECLWEISVVNTKNLLHRMLTKTSEEQLKNKPVSRKSDNKRKLQSTRHYDAYLAFMPPGNDGRARNLYVSIICENEKIDSMLSIFRTLLANNSLKYIFTLFDVGVYEDLEDLGSGYEKEIQENKDNVSNFYYAVLNGESLVQCNLRSIKITYDK